MLIITSSKDLIAFQRTSFSNCDLSEGEKGDWNREESGGYEKEDESNRF